jgi:septal ring factor EnvC (AmiA/AmiB activator)
MQENLERLENKIDKLDEKLHSIDKTLIRQEASLAEHIKRTSINETQLEKFEKEVRPILESANAVKILFSVLAFLVSLGLLVSHFL